MVLEDGGVLKPPANALPCLKSLFVDPQREEDALLSIWNECEAPGHGVVVSEGLPTSYLFYIYICHSLCLCTTAVTSRARCGRVEWV